MPSSTRREFACANCQSRRTRSWPQIIADEYGLEDAEMKAFEGTNPATVNEAVKMLSTPSATDIDEAPRPIAGGQDLLTTTQDYTSRPARLGNLKGIPGMNRITPTAIGLTLGAAVPLT